MSDKSSQRLSMKEIFFVASEIPDGEDREAYLRKAVGDDLQLLHRVERMLTDAESANPNRFDKAVATIDLPSVPENSSPIDIKKHPQIGPYKLIHRLGDGGMGEVFMAEQRTPVQRTVALKLIKRGMDSDEVIARFEAERQALAMMDHPNVAKVLDVGQTEDGRPYFAMDLVRGIPITEYCDQHILDTRARLELLVKVCQAVQHAHQKGIIHRDLKPSNILVELHDVRHVPKVIDFGVAKAINQRLTERTLFTQFAQMVGTPLYMSPEQAELSGIDVDTRSDVYALGVLMYELLTGTTPFEKETLKSAGFDEMRRMIREDDPPRPSYRISTLNDAQLSTLSEKQQVPIPELKRSVERELDWIVLKALEKDRTRRYESASALAADIRRYLDDEAVEACPRSTVYQLGKFARRHKAAIITAVMVAAALLLGIVGTGYQAMRAQKAEQDAVKLAVRAETEAKTAKRESAISKAVNEFINSDLLGTADPHVEPNRDLKVRDVLDRASRKLESRFQDQPLVEAAIRQSLGDAYVGIGESEQAEGQFERCVNIRNEHLGKNHPDTLDGTYGLARSLNLAKRNGEAELLLRNLVKNQRRILGAEHANTLASQYELAVALRYARGRPTARAIKREEAEAMLRETVEVQARVFGAEHEDTLKTKSLLAAMMDGNGRHAKAEQHFREIIAALEHALPQDHPQIQTTVGGLANAIYSRGQTEEAEKIFRDLLGRQRELGATAERFTLTTMQKLADTVRNTQEAGDLLQEVLDIRRSTLGEEHLDTISSMYDLAAWMLERGDIVECRKVYRDALEMNRRVNGDVLHYSLNDLGLSFQKHGQLTDAEMLFREAMRQCVRFYGADSESKVIPSDLKYYLYEPGDHYMTMVVAGNLIYAVLQQDRFAEAADIALDALRMGHKVILSETPSVRVRGVDSIVDNMSTLAWKLAIHQDPEKQDPTKALEIARAMVRLRPEHPIYWRVLGAALYQNGEWTEAVNSFRKAGEVSKVQDLIPHMFFAMAQWQLGNRELAKEIYGQGAAFIDLGWSNNKEAIRLRREAEALMGLTEQDRKQLIDAFFLSAERRHPWFHMGRGIWHQNRGDYKLALEDFRKAEESELSDVAKRLILLLLLNEGNNREAIAELPDIDDLDSSSDFLRNASVYAYSGDKSSYLQLCQRMLKTFADSGAIKDVERTCKVCSILPGVIEPTTLPLLRLETSIEQDQVSPKGRHWFTLARALVRYRLGDSEKALEAIQETQDHERYSQTPAMQALSLTLKAMTQHKLGLPEEANQTLDKVTSLIENSWPNLLNDEFGNGWPDWLFAETLRREAAALLTSDKDLGMPRLQD